MDDKLVMKFEAHTIEHLGVKMYSHTPPALAELIANSYDACSNTVHLRLYDSESLRIEIEDDGVGMSFSEVNKYFLRIGRNRRKENQEISCDRKPTGKKGLGKLALFGLGNKVTIQTIKDGKLVKFTLDYQEILDWEGSDYSPSFEVCDTDEQSGTKIILEELKRKSKFPIQDYSISIAKLFNFKDENFKVFLSLNDGDAIEIHNKLKYENIVPEFEWKFNEIKDIANDGYDKRTEITGKLITTEKPLKPGLRGITLFANGRMVNSAEFFGRAESSHFYSYLSGWLDVDFVDDYEEDFISTDRQSLSWESEIINRLREYLSSTISALEKLWRGERKKKRQAKIKETTNVDVHVWLNNVPENIRGQLEGILNTINNSELSGADQSDTVQGLHTIIPDYPYFHWRQLHSSIQNAAETDYIKKDYYRAFIEAAKRYITETRTKSGSTNGSDQNMMGQVFGHDSQLSVCSNYKKPDGNDFNSDTLKSIEEGQKFLSMGIVAGGRNPVSHEEINDLRDSDLFSEKDCLDGLSLLSHLMKRLENAV